MKSAIAILISGFVTAGMAIQALAADEPNNGFQQTEARDRTVDQAAVSAFRAAIARLSALSKQKQGTAEEPVFLFRLAETMHKAASVEFRLAHGRAAGRKDGVDLSFYKSLLKQSLEPLGTIVTKFPKFQFTARAYYLRSKAYKEIGNNELAIADLKTLIDHYPNFNELSAAYLALYDLLIETKDYRTAISYLKKMAVKSSDPYYSLVLDRQAWAYFYLNELPEALALVEQEVSFFHQRAATTKSQSRLETKSQIDEREKAYSNVALFFATGVEHKNPSFDPAHAVEFFRKLDGGPFFGRMMVQFSYILRTKALDADLDAFKKLALSTEASPQDRSEILMAVMGNQLNRKKFDDLQQSTEQLSALLLSNLGDLKSDAKHQARVQKLLNEDSASLQQIFAVNKENPSSQPIARALIAIYNVLLKAAGNDTSKAMKLHFNLAETSFQVKDYDAATIHYRWIVENGSQKGAAQQGKPGVFISDKALYDDAQLKAVSARYELLRTQGLIPGDLAAKSIGSQTKNELPKSVTEWIGWIQSVPSDKVHSPAEVFLFESNRVLYSQGHFEEAVTRLIDFARRFPSSRYAIPSAALAIDTFLASEKWYGAYRLATGFLNYVAWKDTPFHSRLIEIAADTSFKMMELAYKSGDYKNTLERAEAFLKTYPANRHKDDCLDLAANASLAIKDKRRALAYFTPLMISKSKPEILGTALLTSASVSEEDYDFLNASREYRKYLALPQASLGGATPDDLHNLRRKALTVAWISGDVSELQLDLAAPFVCTAQVSDECAKYKTILILTDPNFKSDHKNLQLSLDGLRKGTPLTRAVWATLALEGNKDLPYKDRLGVLQAIPQEWAQQDAFTKYSLLSYLSNSVPDAIKRTRAQLQSMAKVKADQVSIKKRVKLIEEVEAGLVKVAELPMVRLQVITFNELANVYLDFSNDLGSIPKIKGLTPEDQAAFDGTISEIQGSFIKKAVTIRKKAFDLAQENPVEDDTFDEMASSYLRENDQEARGLKDGWTQISKGVPVTLGFLAKLQPTDGWLGAPPKDTDPRKKFKLKWVAALRNKNWPQVTFLLQEASEKKLLNEGILGVARGLSFSIVGARSEGLARMYENRELLSTSKERSYVLVSLISHYYNAFNRPRTKQLIEELNVLRRNPDDVLSREDAEIVASAIPWSKADVSDWFKKNITECMGNVPMRGPAANSLPSGDSK